MAILNFSENRQIGPCARSQGNVTKNTPHPRPIGVGRRCAFGRIKILSFRAQPDRPSTGNPAKSRNPLFVLRKQRICHDGCPILSRSVRKGGWQRPQFIGQKIEAARVPSHPPLPRTHRRGTLAFVNDFREKQRAGRPPAWKRENRWDEKALQRRRDILIDDGARRKSLCVARY